MTSGMPTSTLVTVTDANSVGTARRAAQQLASSLGFGDVERANAELVATELATNLANHARGGELLLRALGDGATAGGDRHAIRTEGEFTSAIAVERAGIELLALDGGPGIADTAAARRDGFSGGSTLGLGLGAIRRLSQRSDLWSRRGSGTAVVAQLWSPAEPAPVHVPRSELGAICVPRSGETECGDAWSYQVIGSRRRVFVIDGLGHGPEAARAARTAVQLVSTLGELGPGAVLERVHAALRPTRGGAASLADIDLDRGVARYCGVGNTVAAVADATTVRRLVSHNGTLGHVAPRFQEFQVPWQPGSLLIVHTDGLTQKWSLDAYPELLAHHPALVAGVLYRDHARGGDDATVVVSRVGTPQEAQA